MFVLGNQLLNRTGLMKSVLKLSLQSVHLFQNAVILLLDLCKIRFQLSLCTTINTISRNKYLNHTRWSGGRRRELAVDPIPWNKLKHLLRLLNSLQTEHSQFPHDCTAHEFIVFDEFGVCWSTDDDLSSWWHSSDSRGEVHGGTEVVHSFGGCIRLAEVRDTSVNTLKDLESFIEI